VTRPPNGRNSCNGQPACPGLTSIPRTVESYEGAKGDKTPAGSRNHSKPRSEDRRSSGLTRLNSSRGWHSPELAPPRSRRHRWGAGSPVLGSRDLTAARSGWPCGTTAPHAVHVLPPWLTPSHTEQRQTVLMAGVGQCVSARASRPGGLGCAARWPAALAPRFASLCPEGPSPLTIRLPRSAGLVMRSPSKRDPLMGLGVAPLLKAKNALGSGDPW